MTWKNKIGDSFVLGLFSGAALLVVSYFLFEFIRSKTAQYYGNPYLFSPPRVQLFSVLLNVLVFRFLLITYDREKTAKGILFITVIAAFTYLFYFYRFQQQS